MFAFLVRSSQFLFAGALRSDANDAVPRSLMESAGARAGLDPQQARELRSAASAWLRVVR